MSTLDLNTAQKQPLFFVFLIVLGSLSFATALAWNDAIVSLAKQYLNLEESVWGQVTYACIMVGVLIGLAFLLAYTSPKLLKKSKL